MNHVNNLKEEYFSLLGDLIGGLLLGKKIIIIGDQTDILKVIKALFQVLPTKLNFLLTFTITSTSIIDTANIIGFTDREMILPLLNDVEILEEIVILELTTKKAYGSNLESISSSKIIKYIKNGLFRDATAYIDEILNLQDHTTRARAVVSTGPIITADADADADATLNANVDVQLEASIKTQIKEFTETIRR
jgi:hypothetical protein